MTRKEAHNLFKMANNGYTIVKPGLLNHAQKLVELDKLVWIAAGVVAPVEVAEIAKSVYHNPGAY